MSDYWISPEGAAKYLHNTYKKRGVEITYEKILNLILCKCESGEIPRIYIAPQMYDKSHLN